MLALLSLAIAAVRPATPDTLPVRVAVDSAAHEVVLEYRIRPPTLAQAHSADGSEHAAHGAHGAHVRQLARFQWPVSGWIRGARVEVEDPSGRPLPQSRIHHVNLLNFTRRQLVHPAIERLYAAGQESEPIMLPRTVGIPLSQGADLGFLAAFEPQVLPEHSVVRIRVKWTPANTVPRPADVFPLLVDVGFRVGGSPAYDLPPGQSSRQVEFDLPLSGRALAVGGHLHDYGRALELEDVKTGKTLFSVKARLDSAGRMMGMPVNLFGVIGDGRPLDRARRYRVRAIYDSRAAETRKDGAMGEMAILFMPDRPEQWPTVDPSHPDIATDLRGLEAYQVH